VCYAQELRRVTIVVVGCPDDQLPSGRYVYVEKLGDVAVVGCSPGDRRWQLVCHNSSWIGQTGNCTAGNFVSFTFVDFINYYIYLIFFQEKNVVFCLRSNLFYISFQSSHLDIKRYCVLFA
jgi:hypothetical protein